jgi:hypothetical protein
VNVRELRFITAIGVMAIAAFAVLRGADIVRFHLATGSATAGKDAVSLRDWYPVAGVGTVARQAELPLKLDATDKSALMSQRDALAGYLAVRPAASLQWLMLAANRLLLGEPTKNVLAAFSLSVVTGPNENDVIVERSKFGLYLWTELPPELKRREIDDLALGYFSPDEKISLRKLFAALKPQSRQEVLKALPQPRLAVLGLES